MRVPQGFGRAAQGCRRVAQGFNPAIVLALAFLSACAPKVVYTPPTPITPAAFKENANWKPAQPNDATLRGDWWTLFSDPQLDALEQQVDISNQNLKAAEAQFAAARALVRGAKAQLYPQVSLGPAVTVERQSGTRAVSTYHDVYADYLLPGYVTYEADVWGRIHSLVEANRANAQASAADIEAARLSLHAELAGDYFTLRGVDLEQQLLDSAVASYERALQLTQSRFTGGIASQADVALAETQLETTRAQAVDLAVGRAALEHAIAVLVGQPASTFTIGPAPVETALPDVPAGVPSALLERRPDIAAAERRVASASAQIGVATAALYPLITLSGAAGFESSSFGNWLSLASNFWSVAPAALINVFDAGRRRSVVDQAKANYDVAAADYQQSVLGAFREVEDQLAALRVLESEATIQQRAVAAAERSLMQATNRYRGGLASYLEVTVAQAVALTNQRTAVDILTRRLNASVFLMKGIGGGWQLSTLPATP
jgi:NodT family efflux transporter outer membrane factor (OMF) lipoprotein